MQAVLYYSNAESTRMDKTDYITLGKNIDILLKDRSSITDPVILLENENIFNYNYISIPRFDRAYFITDVYSVRNNLWEIHCHVDVLYSFRTQIKSLTALIERQENSYNSLLIDDNVPTQIDKIYDYINYSTPIKSGSIFNTGVSYLLVTASYGDQTGVIKTPKPSLITGYTTPYILSKKALVSVEQSTMNPKFIESLVKLFSNPAEFIVSLKLLSFNPANDVGQQYLVDTQSISVGDKTIELGELNAKYVPNNTIGVKEFEFNIPKKYNNFLDYSPYTEIEVFLPMIGWVNIDTNLSIGKTIYVYYVYDLVTCNANVYISTEHIDLGLAESYNKINSNSIISTYQCSIAVDIPIGASNKYEIHRNLLQAGLNLAVGAASSGINYKGQTTIASNIKKNKKKGNALAARNMNVRADTQLSESMLSLAGSTSANIINNVSSTYNHGSLGGGTADFYSGNPIIRVSRPNIALPEEYSRFIGYPSGKTQQLSELTGFTVIDKIHLEGFSTALDSELEEIEDLLKSGVIF